MTRRRLILALLLVVATLPLSIASGTARAAIPDYTITDLGTLRGATVEATGINTSGQVVGSSDTLDPPSGLVGGLPHAYLWQEGKMQDLGTLSGRSSHATGINDAGQIVGYSALGGGADPSHAFLYSQGKMNDLGTIPGLTYSDARSINARGDVVGMSSNGKTFRRGFLYRDGQMIDIPVRPTGLNTDAFDINDAGQVVGVYEFAGGANHALLYSDGKLTDLGTLPGGASSAAYSINNVGQIVGFSETVTSKSHAFQYQNGVFTDLGTLPGDATSFASSVNNVGQIVGTSRPGTSNGSGRAILVSGGAMIDLNTVIPDNSGWALNAATAINDAGQIVGNGTLNGHMRAFLLTPTTPPAPVQQCFPETSKCLRGAFLAYWQSHGGLAVNGFPISDEFVQTLEDGKQYTVQYLERVRLETHPESADPNYRVQLGQFGRSIHPADPPADQRADATYFAETGHNVSGRFLVYWQAQGGLAQFGYPLTEEFTETLEDGNSYTVQYFERARIEYHPENPDPENEILLGQFGRRIYAELNR